MRNSGTVTDWQKGGLRYAKLKRVVPEFLAPAPVRSFFVGVRSGRRFRLLNPFSPLRREYVLAVTDDEVVILRLRRPGVFRASIAGIAYRANLDQASVAWNNGRCVVNRVDYHPITYHSEDAKQLAALVNAATA